MVSEVCEYNYRMKVGVKAGFGPVSHRGVDYIRSTLHTQVLTHTQEHLGMHQYWRPGKSGEINDLLHIYKDLSHLNIKPYE